MLFPLGAGGMGAIYAARLSGLAGFEKLAAIKVIHPHLMLNSSFVDMFLDEARLAARIDHPHVVRIHEVGQDGEMLYMAMELVRGQSLLALAERAAMRGEPLGAAMCASICAKVALGLHAAHELRDAKGELLDLVHRDVCPQNVLISYEGEVKLIDFGVAFARERLAQTQVGKVKGKLRYMAPERLMGHPTDRRSDIYSLGVVLFEISQPTPYRPEAIPASSDPALLALERGERVGNLPSALTSVIAQATHRNPSARFATAEQFAQALDTAASSLGGAVGPGELGAIVKRLFASEQRTQNARLSSATGSDCVQPARNDAPTVTAPAVPCAMPQPGSTLSPKRRHPRLWTVLGTAALGATIGVSAALVAQFRTSEPHRNPAVPQQPPRSADLTEPTPAPPSTVDEPVRPLSRNTENAAIETTDEPSTQAPRPRQMRPRKKAVRVQEHGKKPSSDTTLFDSPYDK